jgi:hypothetical protein
VSTPFTTATLFGVMWCAASGNTLNNATSSGYSLVMVPPVTGMVGEVSVTGNTLTGKSLLPKRHTPPGLPVVPWSFFNRQYTTAGPDANRGITAAIVFDSSVLAPGISQNALIGTGTNAGNVLAIKAQPGQGQSGAVANNDGGAVHIEGGHPGIGGTGGAGNQGAVQLTSNSLTVSVSSTGVGAELGPLVPVLSGGVTTPITAPMHWMTTGIDFCTLLAVSPPGVTLPYALLTAPNGLLLGLPGVIPAINIDANGININCSGKPFNLSHTVLQHQLNTISTSSGGATIDVSQGCLQALSLTSNVHISAATTTSDVRLELRVAQTGSGGFTVTWDSVFVFNPTSDGTVDPSGLTIYDFSVDSSGKFHCMNVKKGI